MYLARVTGTVVATQKDQNFRGLTLLVLEPLTADRRPVGRAIVAVDTVGAGEGEEVFFVRGREAALPFLPIHVPTDASVIGIVDHWNTEHGPPAASRRRRR
jgi:ethanolamine utilization protein EutN